MSRADSRLTRGIVAGVSFMALLVLGYPLVDEALRLREDDLALAELESEFESIQNRRSRLAKIEEKLQEKKTELTRACVTGEQIPDIRDEIIMLVRSSGAKLRGLEFQDGQTRPWAIENDDPRSRQLPDLGMESDFELQSHTLNLVADGPLVAVQKVIQGMEDHHWLLTIDSLEIKPLHKEGAIIELDLRVTFYGLKAAPVPVDESLARAKGRITY